MLSGAWARLPARSAIGLLSITAILVGACSQGTSTAPSSSPAAASSPPGGSAAPASPTEPALVRLAFPGADFGFLPLFVIQEKGFFEEENLIVETQNLRSNVSVPALMNGDLDVTTAGTSSVWAAKGAPFRAVMYYYKAPSFFLTVSPEIVNPQDLTGKTIAISNPGSQEHIGIQRMLESLGVDPDSVTYLAVGEAGTRYAAAVAGQIVATAEDPDVASKLVEDLGWRVIANAADSYPIPFSGWAIHTDFLANNRDTVRAFIRASLKGLQFVKDNPEETAEIAVKVLEMDAGIAADAVPLVSQLIGPEDIGGITEAALLQNLEEIRKDDPDVPASVGLESIVDFTILREAQKDLGLSCTGGYQCE
jgi:NitT/TauT family transport system substrate-binding protein